MKLPLAIFFQARTIEQLGIRLRQKTQQTRQSSLIEIQPHGSKPPFFCVHPLWGSVICYAPLATHLGLDQPFYGLQSPGLYDAEGLPCSVQELAAHYVNTIRALQVEGPYFIGGWSAGGTIAFEMARQLREQSQRVALLALFDSGAPRCPIDVRETDDTELLISALAPMLGSDLWDYSHTMRQLSLDEQLLFVLNLGQARDRLLPDLELSQARRLFEVLRNNYRILHRYSPTAYPERITLFRARECATEGEREGDLGWQELTTQPLEVHMVSGSHENMVYAPHVVDLAQQLTECIGKVQQPDLFLSAPG